MSIKPTAEQSNIIYDDSQEIFVNARAGTGKTSTLIEYSKLRRNRIIYIVYNVTMKESAKDKFPEWVSIYTIHSLAYSVVGKEYSLNLTNNLSIEDIISLGFLRDSNNDYRFGFNVIQELNAFLNSSDLNFPNSGKETTKIAEKIWLSMIDKKSNTPMSHDGYLKLFHLQQPKLDYDYILIDESQDSNGVMLDIVNNQTHATKVFVGDPYQKIYGFRGALNVFQTISDKSKIRHLSKSFRFGHEIANVANSILSLKDNSDNISIKGCDIDSKIVTDIDDYGKTIITRTNATLIDMAINDAVNNKPFSIQGGSDKIINKSQDIFHLFMGQKHLIKSDYIKTFKNFTEFKGFVNEINIPEYKLTLSLLDKYDKGLMEMLTLVKNSERSLKDSNKLYITAHKSKGLEFVNVELADDFIQLKNNGQDQMIDGEELNLLYVAATRAVNELKLNESLRNICY